MKRLFFCTIVVSLVLGCKPKHETINIEASLPSQFSFETLKLRTITSSIKTKENTMSTLYGNGLAISELKNGINENVSKVEGADTSERMLVLVTWLQKDDPYWFGAKIPSKLLSIECLKSNAFLTQSTEINYQLYDGQGHPVDGTNKQQRINEILTMKPAVLP